MAILIRLLVCLLALGCAGAVSAQELRITDLETPLPGKPGKSWLDLVRMVVPDAHKGTVTYVGGAPIAMRHINGEDEEVEPPATSDIIDISVVDMQVDGKPRTALLFDLSNAPDLSDGFAVLALYDLSGEPRLVDVANVAQDRINYFYEQARLPVGPGHDVLLTLSTHFSSSLAYVVNAMIIARADRLELVDRVLTLDEDLCTHRRVQVAHFAATPSNEPFADIAVSVTDDLTPRGADCGDDEKPAPLSRTISATYRWDAAQQKYLPQSDALEQLAAENAERF